MQIPVRSGREVEPQWRLLWCQERCFKLENTSCRHALRYGAERMGGAAVCLKKALHFGRWVEQDGPTVPYVLITDWREAQPLMGFLEREDAHKPTSLVLMCDSKRQWCRASRWSQSLEPQLFPIIVCDKSSIPPMLLNGLIYYCFSSSSPLTWALDIGSQNSSAQVDVHGKSDIAFEEPVPSSDRSGEGEDESSDGGWSTTLTCKDAGLPSILRMYKLPCQTEEFP